MPLQCIIIHHGGSSMNTAKTVIAFVFSLLVSLSIPSIAVASDNLQKAVGDTAITAQVKANLAADSLTHASTISVKTNNGVVYLSGTTRSSAEASKAVEIAQANNSVRKVDASQLRVQGSNQPLTDAYITAKVKGTFVKNNIINDQGTNVPASAINVETNNGVVTLSGQVNDKAQAKKAVSLAKSVDGVTKVKSNINVS